MKKYKLIKTYPGSPLLGKVLEPKVEKDNEDTNNFYWEGSWFNPNDFPELWEEVDYEIISQSIGVRKCDPKDGYKVVGSTSPVIFSVKRLSDGEIFSVGDKFTGYSPNGNTIQRFELLGNTLFIHTNNQGTITNTPGIGLFKSIKKVVEKDYEIISFTQDSGITDLWVEFENGWCRSYNGKPITNPYTTEEILSNKLYRIASVKRLSEGEVFTIGDKIKVSPYGSDKIISKFSLINDNSSFWNGVWINYDSGSSHIRNAIKIKTKVDMNNAELEFMFFMNGTSGSFKTNLFNTIMSADNTNQKKISLGFPDEVEVVRRYQQEDGYWQELLEKNYDKFITKHI